MGNDIGYDSIVGGGRHATTLHWIDNTGPVTPGELLLLDMGVEATTLYTADVTRTIPVAGTLHPAAARPVLAGPRRPAGRASTRSARAPRSRPPHQAAMSVLAHGLEDLGLLPVSAEEALSPDSKVYARWTLHSTSHMLGMDVHDCAGSRPEVYTQGDLAEGMVLTVEPGLYFQEDDLLVPEEMRGHRHPDRGRHPGHRRRPPEPVRRRSPATRTPSRSGWARCSPDRASPRESSTRSTLVR